MKRSEIENCFWCAKGVAHAGPVFYRITLDQLVLDRRAIELAAGLEALVGNAAIASALGPDEDLAKAVQTKRRLLCAECALNFPVLALLDGEGLE
ncbi:MAG TPA: hypothetical protein VK090_06630 [Paracoccaceae bacterium]|nr:hypothetical protein [Paracoccaceae bacterium]